MKWILAGLAFALLIGLAVFTVAVKARNLQVRATIAHHNQQILSLRVEAARRAARTRGNVETRELLRRLRELLDESRQQGQ